MSDFLDLYLSLREGASGSLCPSAGVYVPVLLGSMCLSELSLLEKDGEEPV